MLPWLCSELLFFCNLLCKPSSNPNTSFFFPFWHQKYQFLPHSHAAEMQALDLTPSAILVPVSPVPSANTGGFRRAQMRFSLPGGLQHSQSMSKKNLLGSGKGWGYPAVPPSFSILCWLWLLCPKSSQGRQGAGRQDTSRWKTMGKTPNPFPEQRKGPRSLQLPQCPAFGL